MLLSDAIRKKINEILEEKKVTLTELCLNSNLTPSTVFDFMSGKSEYPKINTLNKLCSGAEISLKDFFDREYFIDTDEIYQ